MPKRELLMGTLTVYGAGEDIAGLWQSLNAQVKSV